MQRTQAPNLSDFLKLGEAALSVLIGAGQKASAHLPHKRDALIRKLDLVTREEFDVAFAMIKKARAAQEALEKRLAILEGKPARKVAPKKATPAPRKTPRKTVKKKLSRKK